MQSAHLLLCFPMPRSSGGEFAFPFWMPGRSSCSFAQTTRLIFVDARTFFSHIFFICVQTPALVGGFLVLLVTHAVVHCSNVLFAHDGGIGDGACCGIDFSCGDGVSTIPLDQVCNRIPLTHVKNPPWTLYAPILQMRVVLAPQGLELILDGARVTKHRHRLVRVVHETQSCRWCASSEAMAVCGCRVTAVPGRIPG